MSWLGVPLMALALAASSAEVVETAQEYLGYPYVYGSKGSYGFDCSSFVQAVYREHGYSLPRTSRRQAEIGTPVSWDALQPGDLLFFAAEPGGTRVSHVGLALDGGMMIHASTGRGEVVVDPLDMRYYRLRRLGARRILDHAPESIAAPPDERGAQHQGPLAPTLSSVPRPTLWHRGPVPLDRARTSIGVRVIGAAVGERALGCVAPRLSIRHEALDIEGVLHAPFAGQLAPWEAAWKYDEAEDYLRVVERLRVGDPEGRLYFEASRTLSLTLGDGLLVSGTTPASAFQVFAGLAAHAPFAVAARGALRDWKAELVIDDVVQPAVLGGSVGYEGPLGLRVTVAADPRAPSRAATRARSAIAVEGSFPLLERGGWLAAAEAALGYADAGQPALGGQGGAWLKLRSGAAEYALRAAVRLHDPGFVPGLFGVDYRRLRRHGTEEEPIWDTLDRLALASPWRWGWELTGRVTVTRRFGLRVTYIDDAPLLRRGDHVPLRALELGLLARDFYVAAWDASVSGHVAYHLRMVGGFGSAFSLDNDRELLFAGVRIAPTSALSVGLQVAKRPRGDDGFVEGMVDLIAALPL